MGRRNDPPDFTKVLDAAARLQSLVPDAVLVGGSAAALHAHHRVSFDDDHIVADLRGRYDHVLSALEATDEWVTARVQRPVLILGSLDGIETGIRQLIRVRPLEVEEFVINGKPIRVPTLAEILRIKGWLILRRNAMRDHLDFVALADRMGPGAAQVAFGLDDYYADQIGPDGARIATQLAKQLADPAPYDLDQVELHRYRQLEPRWRQWDSVVSAARGVAAAMLDLVARSES